MFWVFNKVPEISPVKLRRQGVLCAVCVRVCLCVFVCACVQSHDKNAVVSIHYPSNDYANTYLFLKVYGGSSLPTASFDSNLRWPRNCFDLPSICPNERALVIEGFGTTESACGFQFIVQIDLMSASSSCKHKYLPAPTSFSAASFTEMN